jgi:hypothetical protein
MTDLYHVLLTPSNNTAGFSVLPRVSPGESGVLFAAARYEASETMFSVALLRFSVQFAAMNTLTSKLNRTEANTLVIHCGDYRFQVALHEFLNRTLQLASYDLMVIPGGPLTLTGDDPFPKYHWATWKWLRFFVEQHKLTRLILIQHQDCGFYKAMAEHLNTPLEQLRRRQEHDLRRARETMGRELPHVAVDLYYAGWDSSDRVVLAAIA